MKIAISATGNSLESSVDPRMGRAAWFLIVDTEDNTLLEAIDNSAAKEAAHGAGISAAAQIADRGVSAILTGRVGPKALPIFSKAGIESVNNASGTILEAIADFVQRKPSPTATTIPNTPENTQGRGMGMGRNKGQGQGQGMGQGQGRGKNCRRQ